MKIDLPPVRCFDEAAIFPGEEVLDAAVACFRMMLHLTAKFAHDVFDLSHCSVEGLPDRDQRVFALRRIGMGLVDDNLVVLGHRDAKLDLEAAAPMSGLRPGDDDATTRNARTEFFETLHLRGDLGSDLFGRLAMPKGDVDWSLHIDPSPPPNKVNDTPLIARRLAADQRPRRALAGSLTTNRRYRPSYSSPQQRPPPSRSCNGRLTCAPREGSAFQRVQAHPATAPAGSNRSSHGGDEVAEAFGVA